MHYGHSNKLFIMYLISLFAHIGYNPIEQHNILTIHVNYIKNNILEKKEKKRKKKMYIITAKQVTKSTVITLHTIYNGVN